MHFFLSHLPHRASVVAAMCKYFPMATFSLAWGLYIHMQCTYGCLLQPALCCWQPSSIHHRETLLIFKQLCICNEPNSPPVACTQTSPLICWLQTVLPHAFMDTVYRCRSVRDSKPSLLLLDQEKGRLTTRNSDQTGKPGSADQLSIKILSLHCLFFT